MDSFVKNQEKLLERKWKNILEENKETMRQETR